MNNNTLNITKQDIEDIAEEYEFNDLDFDRLINNLKFLCSKTSSESCYQLNDVKVCINHLRAIYEERKPDKFHIRYRVDDLITSIHYEAQYWRYYSDSKHGRYDEEWWDAYDNYYLLLNTAGYFKQLNGEFIYERDHDKRLKSR